MDKELKAIVWLGALLGLLMGCINCFVRFRRKIKNRGYGYKRKNPRDYKPP